MSLRVHALFFAGSRDAVGTRSVQLELDPGSSVLMLLDRLGQQYPKLAPMLTHVQVAVNQEYVQRDHELADGDEIAVIPPVSGGVDEGSPDSGRFCVTESPIDPAHLHEVVRSPADGAVVTFSGVVRDHTGDRPTSHLLYEAYAPMAARKMAELAERARERWPVGDIAIHHRIGRLEVGEISVLASVASTHRAEAFEACRFLIDELKASVPIWKKEVGPDGEYWVEGPRSSAGSQVA